MLKYGVDPEGLPKTAAQDGDGDQDEEQSLAAHAALPAKPAPPIAPQGGVGAQPVRRDAPDANSAAHPPRDHDGCP